MMERKMPTLDEIGREKQRIAERLAKLDADRAKLAEELNELEVAERVLSRFGKAESGQRRRRGRPARSTAATAVPAKAPRRRRRAATQPKGISISDAALRAVQARPEGSTAGDLLQHLERDFGLKVRPNHLGIALQRHRRAGRLDQRDSRWFPPASHPGSETAAA
jgi:hypothetical protein